jgi:lipopolysaccharide O-acetyltransferase
MPLQASSNPILKFGRNVQINDFVHIGAIESITIQDNVLIASRVFISDHNHGCYSGSSRHSHPESVPIERLLSFAPVGIEENVWIEESVSILPGVPIGKGSIIGTQSDVAGIFPSFVSQPVFRRALSSLMISIPEDGSEYETDCPLRRESG